MTVNRLPVTMVVQISQQHFCLLLAFYEWNFVFTLRNSDLAKTGPVRSVTLTLHIMK